ncbi:ABC-three component system protein [uncultured Polaribacter sp.]|uniref:ABC-three component system protein n=1 Tax=uncultured Polaribacter sp. TaxID=174711 RepID=UPI00261349F6|nr:ABC-three component system protein [uncultured Polaribacter sp.]
MKYPLENLDDTEFENLVALICSEILGIGTVVFSKGTDFGKDAKFYGKANRYPSESKPWEGKVVIQAKHTVKINASCSDSSFQTIIKNEIIPAINILKEADKIDYYLLFTNRKLSGGKDAKIEDVFENEVGIENRLIGLETIDFWINQYPKIARTLNKLLLPLSFDENDLKEIINSFSKVDKKKGNLPKIPKRDIEKKNELNNLSKDYFNNVIKRNLLYIEQIREFLTNPINTEYLGKYENTIDDINEEIVVHRDEFDKFDLIFNYLYKFIVENNPELKSNRSLVRLFLHYMYYNCDIGINE